MDKLLKKLNSDRGVSMMMALLYLMVALILGASVLTAAQVNAGRIGRNKAQQQAYYALNSAAQLIQEDMSGASLSFTGSTRVTKTWDAEAGVFGNEQRQGSPTSFDVGTESVLMYSLRPELTEFYASAGGTQADKTIALSFSAVEELEQVDGNVIFTRGDNDCYKVVYELYTLHDGERSGELYLSFSPIVDSSTERSETTENLVNTVTTVETTTVSWGKPVITGGEAA